MKDFTFQVQAADDAPMTSYYYPPQILFVRVMMNDDMTTCTLKCETTCIETPVAPYTRRETVTYSELQLPLAMIQPILAAGGAVDPDALNTLLAGFKLQLRTSPPPEETPEEAPQP
jgi:hypothetical protein